MGGLYDNKIAGPHIFLSEISIAGITETDFGMEISAEHIPKVIKVIPIPVVFYRRPISVIMIR